MAPTNYAPTTAAPEAASKEPNATTVSRCVRLSLAPRPRPTSGLNRPTPVQPDSSCNGPSKSPHEAFYDTKLSYKSLNTFGTPVVDLSQAHIPTAVSHPKRLVRRRDRQRR